MNETAKAQRKVYKIEREKWNALAAESQSSIRPVAPGENFHRFAQRSRTMEGMAEFLGDLDGKQVLEYGCGLGQLSVLLAKSGANVHAFDISEVSVGVTRKRAEINDVADRVTVTTAAGESLPFADESFDVVVGKAVLHHLNVDLSAGHLYRVLKENGKATFTEPMGMNPLLKLGRDHLPYPDKNPRGADHPLNYNDINRWGEAFREFSYHELQLLSMFERVLGFKRRLPFLQRVDEVLLKQVPFLRRYCRYVVLFMVK